MTAHTPGPWYVTGSSAEGCVFGGPKHRLIVPWPEDGAPKPDDWNGVEDSCNRRLIASAPALLAACKAAEDALGCNLQWLADQTRALRNADKGDGDARLATLNAGWVGLCKAIRQAREG